jgi:metallo-beta-lactamase family protein
MQMQFCGGAQTVTGSQTLITVNGKKILFECGLFQGRRQEAYEKNQTFMFNPAEVDCLILSHAHIDHSGNIPNLVKQGFKGSIYATPATIDLCKIMLRDSAHLQEKDLEWVNIIRKRSHQPELVPLYTLKEVEATMDLFVPIDFDKEFTIAKDVQVMFRDAGHILGSAGIHLEITENNKTFKIGFSGDVGRPGMPLTKDPNVLRELDVLVMESTYGNRLHDSFDNVEEELCKLVRDTAAAGGKLIIPSFAVGRTQTLVYVLHKLYDQDRIPELPIYVDSPLACDATTVFEKYPDLLDREAQRVFIKNHVDPFQFNRLSYVHEASESKKLNSLAYPHVIISGSGMAEGGRILHHLKNNIDNSKNTLLFIGYAARETLARKIMDGNKIVKIFGEDHTVRNKIHIMDAFSAHADRRNLLDYVDLTPPSKLKHVILVHGELDQSQSLRDAIRSKGYQNVHIPAPGDTFTFPTVDD